MTKGVGSWPGNRDSGFMKIVGCAARYGRESYGSARGQSSEEDMTVRGFGPATLKIIQDCFSHDGRQRVCCKMVSLPLRDTEPLSSPINVI